MDVANLPAHSFGVVDRLALVQQLVNEPNFFPKHRMLDRRQAHHAPPGMSGAETEDYAPRSYLVDGADSLDGDRRYAVGSDRHAGSELDFGGVDGGKRHAGPHVAPNHVRIGNPGVRVAILLGELGIANRALWFGQNQGSVFHRDLPPEQGEYSPNHGRERKSR